ncbi:hypothetical protein CDL12_22424 [Handroanthus impetiginosus]|uniref:Uncharacterized protein n=1 Tax=Handroanthus impetiginosus TaxID=429701 RepID=A0A2G9GIB0_9LAMI|nr:hypothetical protein CDL12_22424 [Handroanthus impetiginosus]
MDVTSISTQSQANESTIEAPFQEDIVATPLDVLITIDFDQSHILVDDNANPIEIPEINSENEDKDKIEDEDNEEDEAEFEDIDSNSEGDEETVCS